MCSENPGLSGRYHAGFWSGKRWSCCRMSTRSAEGCDTCSSWSAATATATKPGAGTPSITSANSAAAEQRHQQAANATTGTTTTETNNNPVAQTRSNNGEYRLSTAGCGAGVFGGGRGWVASRIGRSSSVQSQSI